MEFNAFDSIKIGLASPEQIREWCYGEVKKPETINYRTLKPETRRPVLRAHLRADEGLGVPLRQVQAHPLQGHDLRPAAALRSPRAKVRRERMGHIELAAPVSHIWYFKGIPVPHGPAAGYVSPASLEKVLYFAAFIVTGSRRHAAGI